MNVPIIINALLLLDIQIRMSSSGDVNVLEWNKKKISQRVKFDSGFNVMVVFEVFPDMDHKSFIASPATRSES